MSLPPSRSLRPTSLHIRLLQSSEPGTNHRRCRCAESTFQKCKHIRERIQMSGCVCSNFVLCIDRIDFPKGIFSRLRYRAKLIGASWKCPTLCFRDQKEQVIGFKHAFCLIDSFVDMNVHTHEQEILYNTCLSTFFNAKLCGCLF